MQDFAIFQDDAKNHIRFEYYGQEKSIRLVVCCKEKEEIVKEIKDEAEAFKIFINGLKADFGGGRSVVGLRLLQM